MGQSVSMATIFEVGVLGCGVYYFDLVTDCLVLNKFWREEQYWFFGMNVGGILWNAGMSAVATYLYMDMQTSLRVFFQLEPAVAAITIFYFGEEDTGASLRDPPKNATARLKYLKMFEMFEGCVSLLVQFYDLIWNPALSDDDQRLLSISVCVSALALSNALASNEKEDSLWEGKVKHLFSVEYVCFFLFNVCQVGARFGSLCLFQLICRPFGAFAIVAFDLFLWCINAWYHYAANRKSLGNLSKNCLIENLSHGVPSVGYFFAFGGFNSPFLSIVPRSSDILNAGMENLVVVPTVASYFWFRMLETIVMFAYAWWISNGLAGMYNVWFKYNAIIAWVAPVTAGTIGGHFALYFVCGAMAKSTVYERTFAVISQSPDDEFDNERQDSKGLSLEEVIRSKNKKIKLLSAEGGEKDKTINKMDQKITSKVAAINDMDKKIILKDNAISNKDQAINEKENQIRDLQKLCEQKDKTINDLNGTVRRLRDRQAEIPKRCSCVLL